MPDFVNAQWADVRPSLSVLIPFYRDDPRPLLSRLSEDVSVVANAVEIVMLDDGTADPAFTQTVKEKVSSLPLATRLITLSTNVGRAKGRNMLAKAARGQALLFLDADMLPDATDFLSSWLDVARADHAVVFGGFTLLQAPRERQFAVHRSMAASSDCLPAAIRVRQPAKHVFTSNLLVRAEVFATTPFDDTFTGWGWEDVEWGIRVSRSQEVHHTDIPATHMGLDTTSTLMEKYRQSAANFARMAAQHPDVITTYPSYRAAEAIRQRGLIQPVKTFAERIATLEWAPVRVRGFMLRVYRAALYAESLQKRETP